MKWNVFLMIVSMAMLLLFVGTGLVQHLVQAEAIAESLSAEIGVDKDILWDHLESILQRGSIRRTVIYCSPLAILTVLLTVRLIVDVAGKKKESQ